MRWVVQYLLLYNPLPFFLTYACICIFLPMHASVSRCLANQAAQLMHPTGYRSYTGSRGYCPIVEPGTGDGGRFLYLSGHILQLKGQIRHLGIFTQQNHWHPFRNPTTHTFQLLSPLGEKLQFRLTFQFPLQYYTRTFPWGYPLFMLHGG